MTDYTKQQISEFIKCQNDPVYFINNYVKINTFEGEKSFKLYDYQEDLIRHFHENQFSICIAPRQSGKSLDGVAYILHHIIFNDYVTAGIFSYNRDSSRNLLDLLREMLSKLPDWLKPKVIISNKKDLELENGSRVLAPIVNSRCIYDRRTVKAIKYDISLLNEFAFVPDEVANDFWHSVAPVIFSSSKSKLIITSTPKFSHKLKEIINEEGNPETIIVPTLFYKLWSDANLQANEFNPIRIYWHQHPDRDEKWKAETIARIGEDAWSHEYECKFRTEKTITKERVVKLYQLHESTSTEPTESQIREYMKTTGKDYYNAREEIREEAYGTTYSKSPVQSWGDFWKTY